MAEPASRELPRLRRIFAGDGRSVIVALDHGLAGFTDLGALRRPAEILSAVKRAGADCVLVTPGILQAYPHVIGQMGVIVRLDGGVVTHRDEPQGIRQLASVEDAMRWGADGVALLGLTGTPDEAATLQRIAETAAVCGRWGMPLLAEMLPGGYGADPKVDEVAVAARVACELGASIVKVPFCGSVKQFGQVIAGVYRPVVVLGGGGGADVADRLRGAIEAGSSGVAVGRDVWRSEDPARMTNELVELVHPGDRRSDG